MKVSFVFDRRRFRNHFEIIGIYNHLCLIFFFPQCIVFVVILAVAAVNGHVIAPYPIAYHAPLSYAYAPQISLTHGLGLPIQLTSHSLASATSLGQFPLASLIAGTSVNGAPAYVHAPGTIVQSVGAPAVVAAVPSA